MEKYMTVAQAAEKWGISNRRVQEICSLGKIDGLQRFGKSYAIPVTCSKPKDNRIKTGQYIGFFAKYHKE